MRRTDREVADYTQLLDIMTRCEICNIAFFDDTYPYIIPLNFGIDNKDDVLYLYFHCASKGKKLDLLHNNHHVGFSMYGSTRLIKSDKACSYTMTYESICGNGIIEIVKDNEKEYGLTKLMEHYDKEFPKGFDYNMIKTLTILKMKVLEISGKHLEKD